MTWLPSGLESPRTLEDWIIFIERQVDRIANRQPGLSRSGWNDPVDIGPGYEPYGPFLPGWRKLTDGRVELRGRVRRTNGAAPSDGDVLLLLPYECSPPNSQYQDPSVVSMVGITDTSGGGPGTVRLDARRESAWRTDGEGSPVSSTELVLRLPTQTVFTGWIGFDNTLYDPMVYLDSLPPVPFGQQPMGHTTQIVVFEHDNGKLELLPAGVQHPENEQANREATVEIDGRMIIDTYGLLRTVDPSRDSVGRDASGRGDFPWH